jgi:hypothetical protein
MNRNLDAQAFAEPHHGSDLGLEFRWTALHDIPLHRGRPVGREGVDERERLLNAVSG